MTGSPIEVDVDELARWRLGGAEVTVLDVREPWETAICALSGSLMVPMAQVPASLGRLPRDRPLVVLCHHGVRSLHVAGWLRAQGLANAVSLRGGIDAWARRVDIGMQLY